MKLIDVLRSECVRAGSNIDDKALALCEIAALAKQCKTLKKVSEDDILEALQERETLGTTAFGNGVAIPHCRLKNVKDFVVGLLTVPAGVEFESTDGKKVQMIVFIIAPQDQSNTHIRLLSAVSRALQDQTAVKKMVKAKTDAQLRKLFLEAAGQDISEQIAVRHNLVQVFVQDEKIFKEIVEAVATLDNASFCVIEGQNGRRYLGKSGLLAQFAEHQNESACHILVATIERRLSNEVIRRIESITGSLFECTGVMVSVQEMAYSAGSLEI
ncbi:MAG: PTS sugar transporter subunit IIA [Planctomycetaceae bacterium]|nr:PTS sugar transporter subunit IIA [Planctomycetaceae bacterium]